ncbi:hypothetical protein [Devosia sp. RR2S18]|uniref:hypothetical protein n=1 Tax=Devosia rhizosphaerae TaxID=3049774 RepID=UPI0025425259|nr:hypothetical protein [Devosia sp. RR2S18]WIJ23902.1 hypothetical protein QOV41_12670 [Devosia sp. RR2S18]
MKASVLAFATAAAFSLAAAGHANAQFAADDPVVDGCAINENGYYTDSGVTNPMNHSLVEDSAEDYRVPVDPCMADVSVPNSVNERIERYFAEAAARD